MKPLPSILSAFVLSLVVGIFVAHAEGYAPLAPLPGTFTGSAGQETTNLSTYLSGAIKLLIALGAGLAVLFAVIGGTQYVAASINPSAKAGALERIQNSIIGLLIILSSYLLLNSINPKLVQFNLALPPLSLEVYKEPLYVPPVGSCASCIPISADVPQKPPGAGCATPGPCQVSAQIAGKLSSLSYALSAKGISWQVSEAWPPTRKHVAACQNPGPQAGMCVDASLLSPRTPANIDLFITTASSNGLKAVYEVPTKEREKALRDGGLAAPWGNLLVVEGITGEHFSVYNK